MQILCISLLRSWKPTAARKRRNHAERKSLSPASSGTNPALCYVRRKMKMTPKAREGRTMLAAIVAMGYGGVLAISIIVGLVLWLETEREMFTSHDWPHLE